MHRLVLAALACVALSSCMFNARSAEFVHRITDHTSSGLVGVPCDAPSRQYFLGEHFVRAGIGNSLLPSGEYGAPFGVGVTVMTTDSGAASFTIHAARIHSAKGRTYHLRAADSVPLTAPLRLIDYGQEEDSWAKRRRFRDCTRQRAAREGLRGLGGDINLDFDGRDTVTVTIDVSVNGSAGTQRGVFTYVFVPERRRVFTPIV